MADRGQEEDAKEILPDEAAVIAERAPDLEELDEDEFLSAEEMASNLGIDRKKMENRRELVERTDDDDFVRLDETWEKHTMSETAGDDSKLEQEAQENIDQAVEDVKKFNFLTLGEVKKAFQQ